MHMDTKLFEVEPFTLFADSQLWQINRDYYQNSGIEAWSKGIVPHQITSNSLAGKTYARIIVGCLRDLADKGRTAEIVYIVELGAGHGRLGYHVLRHLDKLIAAESEVLPPYCYVLSDIVEENLTFFKEHAQLQPYYESGRLDYAYYDGVAGESIHLRYADKHIEKGSLRQSIIALGNYFFDSLPTDLYHIQKDKLSVCSVALHTSQHPSSLEPVQLLGDLRLTYKQETVDGGHYATEGLDAILHQYQTELHDTYLFFPEKSMLCIENLKALSTGGAMVLSMDKGFHDIAKLDRMNKPDIVTHGSFSLWVNFHALGRHCEQSGGRALFPQYSTFHLQVACLLCMPDALDYTHTSAAYEAAVNDFGPDDFNTLKKYTYTHVDTLSLMELLALLRLSSYDAAFFTHLLPQIKIHVQELTHEERERLAQSLEQVWSYYFNINEKDNLALQMAGLHFDLGYFEQSLVYYQHSTDVYGIEMDTCYNRILCYYQLRQDDLFRAALAEAVLLFPDSDVFAPLFEFDLGAE